MRERSANLNSMAAATIGGGFASECANLSRQIDYYDAPARQPNSAYTQDWIRERRKALRDRQFAVRRP